MLVGGSYYSLKYYVYTKINRSLKHQIAFEKIGIGFFPLCVYIDDIKDFRLKNKNIISFEKIRAEIPFSSLFTKIKELDVTIYHPKVVFDESLLKKDKESLTSESIKIAKVSIVDGELTYSSSTVHAVILNFNVKSFQVDQDVLYRFTTPHLRITFPFSGKTVEFEGEATSEFREEWNSWKVTRFYWDTPYLKISLNGRIIKDARFVLNAYVQGSLRQILDPLLGSFSIRDFANIGARINRSKDGTIGIDGTVALNTFKFNTETFKDLKGTFNWNNQDTRLRFDLNFHDNLYKTNLKIDKTGTTINIDAQNLSAAKMVHIVEINDVAPLSGMIKQAHLSINGSLFTGKAQLVQPPNQTSDNTLMGSGWVDFFFDTKTKTVRFSSPRLQTEFGQIINLKGVSDPHHQTQLDLSLHAAIDQASALDKYTTFYIDMPLSQWKLSKGVGIIDLDVKKINKIFFVETDIHMRDMYSGIEKIQLLKGHISTQGKLTTGKLEIDDPGLKCTMNLSIDTRTKKDIRFRFFPLWGETKKIMNILGFDIALSGPMTGDFVYTNKAGMVHPNVEGTFHSSKINLYDFDIENISGSLQYSTHILLKNLKYNYMEGTGNGNLFIDFKEEKFNVDGRIKDINLSRLNSQFAGKGDVAFKGKGGFFISPITLTYSTNSASFYRERNFSLKGDGKIYTDFSDFRLETAGNILDRNILSPYTFRLNKTEKQLTGNFHVNITDINLLIPWGNNKGQMAVDGTISGQKGASMHTEGHATFKGKVLSFPMFSQAIRDFSGDLIFNDSDFSLRSFKGSLGDGPVEGNGYLTVRNNRLNSFRLNISGKKMNLYPMDRTNFTLDADVALTYIKERDKLLLSGSLELLSGLWEREIDEGISFNTSASLTASGTSFLDMLEYDLKMVSKGEMNFNNSFGEGVATFNLKLTGNRDFPVMTGIVESKKGKILFSGKNFDLVKARLVYTTKFVNNPTIDIESEAFIKNYRIKFTISGLASKAKPELQSSPPLPPRDILSLIAVGELFRRPTASELSTQIGTGTTNLIASELAQQIAKRTKKIFGNYMLRFEPNISNITGSSVDTSRLIVGKEITKNFLVVYSTDFSTQRQQVVYLQYQISPTLSLIGMRNEDGRISFDLRYRKRH
ncbi:MAG: translocation/assembly module TamB domain-containing protein [Candidatus Omnitrophota bacterium]